MAESIFGGKAPSLTVNMLPHDGQIEVTRAIRKAVEEAPEGAEPSVFMIIGSRGWGKTLYQVTQVLLPFIAQNANSRVLWVGPHYQTALAFVEDVLKATDEETGKRWVPEYDEQGNRVWEFVQSTPSGPQVRFWNGSTVTIKSADSPDSIVGRGYNLIIIDEAGMIDERVFLQQIMGTARKKGIKIFIITSPRGKRHWTYRYFLKGQDPAEKDYLSFLQPWHKNPKFSPTLRRLMDALPDWIRRQEYNAEFLDDGAGVFKNLESVIKGPEISFQTQDQTYDIGKIGDLILQRPGGELRIPANERRFIVGQDLAKSADFTVMWVMDLDSGECVYYRRLNKTDYREILSITESICKRFNHAELIFDGTGVGSGLADFYQNHDISAHPYVFTNESKSDLVVNLALAIEYGEVTIPNIPTIINEMAAFTYSLSRTGKLTYSAPSGHHDDIVMAFALANWFRRQNAASTNVAVLDDFIRVNSAQPKSFYEWIDEDND